MKSRFIYTYNSRTEEESLCALEMRTFFGKEGIEGALRSSIKISPDRSPFLKERIEILYESPSLKGLLKQISTLPPFTGSCKVQFVKNRLLQAPSFAERKSLEKAAAGVLHGKVNLSKPDFLFAVFPTADSWVFGHLHLQSPVWKNHEQKPFSYSTALPVRTARSVANIAVPAPENVRAVDPCCGIGTVLIEARSMGIAMEGSDMNPKIMHGLRRNLEHFGYLPDTEIADMRTIQESYDAAVIDMPYNLCSVLPAQAKLEMLHAARRFTKRLVLVTIEPIDLLVKKAGFTIIDRGTAGKNKSFYREVIVCE